MPRRGFQAQIRRLASGVKEDSCSFQLPFTRSVQNRTADRRTTDPNQEATMPVGLLILVPLIAVMVLVLRRVGPPGGDRPHRPPPCCTVREIPKDSPPRA